MLVSARNDVTGTREHFGRVLATLRASDSSANIPSLSLSLSLYLYLPIDVELLRCDRIFERSNSQRRLAARARGNYRRTSRDMARFIIS